MANKTDCDMYYEIYPDPSAKIFFLIPFSIIYVSLFVLGLAGNSLLIYVTCQNKTLQSVQNIFILNLAASDVMMCILSLPITPVTNVYKNWYFGAVLCHLIPCIQGISIFICTFSLAAIAVDRYILVVKPHSRPLTRRGAITVTVFLWVMSITVTIPYAFYMDMVNYNGVCGWFCTEMWPSAASRRAYTMMVMASQFALPFICMTFCYTRIFGVLSKRAKVKLRRMDERSFALEQSITTREPSHVAQKSNGNDECMNTFLDKQEKEKHRLVYQTRRTTSILVSMVVWFGLTWLPHNVVSLIIEFDENANFFQLTDDQDTDISYLVNLFTHCFAMSNIVVNPVLYAWLNPTFRQLVVNTCIIARNKNRKATYLTISTKITENPKPTIDAEYSSRVRSSKNLSLKSSNDMSDSRDESYCADQKNLMIETDENDTFV